MLKAPQYCQRCVYSSAAVNLELDDEGNLLELSLVLKLLLSSRKMSGNGVRKKFEQILEETNRHNTSNYDCIIPVSGGKDSYYQTHVIAAQYGLKPLLVTYHGNNYLPEGDYNRDRMRHVFDADHIVFGPSVEVLQKLNRICFRKMGDMNWHAHCGIFHLSDSDLRALWNPAAHLGEISWDVSGMFDPDDFVEFSARGPPRARPARIRMVRHAGGPA
jgi:hypothetical protein